MLPDGSEIPFYLFGNHAHSLTACFNPAFKSFNINKDNPSRILFLSDHFIFSFFCVELWFFIASEPSVQTYILEF